MSTWIVSGGAFCNGIYVQNGTYNESPAYTNGTYWLYRIGSWLLGPTKGGAPYYYSQGTGILPDNPWESNGPLQPPTLTEKLGTVLTKSLSDSISAGDSSVKDDDATKSDSIAVSDNTIIGQTLKLPNALIFTGWRVTGAGNNDYNGLYTENGTNGSYPAYTNGTTWLYEESTVPGESWNMDYNKGTPIGACDYYTISTLPGNPWQQAGGDNPPPTVAAEWGEIESTESMYLSDSIVKTPNVKENETISIVEDFSKISEFKPDLSDLTLLLDIISIDIRRSIGLNFADEITSLDGSSLSETYGNNFSKNLADVMGLGDSNHNDVFSNISDTISLIDTQLKNINIHLSDTNSLADAILEESNYYRTLTDTTSLSDLISYGASVAPKIKYSYSKMIDKFNQKSNFAKINNRFSKKNKFTKMNNIKEI